MGFEHGLVPPVPAASEVETPLLDPARPVGWSKPVGQPSDRVGLRQYTDWSLLVGHPVMTHLWPADRHGIWGKLSREEPVLLILDDQQTAGPDVCEQSSIVRDQR